VSFGMKAQQIERLRQSEGKVVKITCSDGELLEAKIIHVDDEYRDAIYDLVSSTTPEKYKQGAASSYVIRWDNIVDFE
jgi:small nuclear ribonucleoprotein (snRNP)-like protein